jgi:hypothetical protein
VCRDLAEVPELGIDDRHGLLAEAAKGLAVLLGEPAALCRPFLVRAWESADDFGRFLLRGSDFRG